MRLVDSLKILEKACDKCDREACEQISKGSWNSCFIKELIDNAETVEERKHGEWEYIGLEHVYSCSVCDKIHDISYGFDFCPNCGADMRGET